MSVIRFPLGEKIPWLKVLHNRQYRVCELLLHCVENLFRNVWVELTSYLDGYIYYIDITTNHSWVNLCGVKIVIAVINIL